MRQDASTSAQRRAVQTAVLAPSSHNLQPWRFRLGSGFVDPFADRPRCLPVLDPRDRELTLGCGAALFYLRLALRHAGLAERAQILPDLTEQRVAWGMDSISLSADVADRTRRIIAAAQQRALLNRTVPDEIRRRRNACAECLRGRLTGPSG